MDQENIVSLITNVGFPVALCIILLRCILQTLGEELDKLDDSVNQLITAIKNINNHNKTD